MLTHFMPSISQDRPDNGAEVRLSDWKQLPPGYNLDPLVLGAMPERIDLRYLSLPRPRPDLPLNLKMPALKYLPDGRLDGVDLNGFYLSISQGDAASARVPWDSIFLKMQSP